MGGGESNNGPQRRDEMGKSRRSRENAFFTRRFQQ